MQVCLLCGDTISVSSSTGLDPINEICIQCKNSPMDVLIARTAFCFLKEIRRMNTNIESMLQCLQEKKNGK